MKITLGTPRVILQGNYRTTNISSNAKFHCICICIVFADAYKYLSDLFDYEGFDGWNPKNSA